jgi:putative transposase
VRASKFYDWRERYGRVKVHNGWIPRDFGLEPWEKETIIGFHRKNPLEGYRRLTSTMLDAEVVAVSPSSLWPTFTCLRNNVGSFDPPAL